MLKNSGKPAGRAGKAFHKSIGQSGIIVIILLIIFIPAVQGENAESNFKISFSERFRLLTWDNTITLDDAAAATNTFTRHRTSIMGQYYPLSNLEAALKLTNEFRYYFMPADREFDINEVFIDQLYIKWQNKYAVPGTLTLGRQNIRLGEGFVVMDGHPLDGSRSIYFNAARFDWDINAENSLTFFYSYQTRTDKALPIINEYNQMLVEQPEKGFGLYYSGKYRQFDIQAYFIRKNVEPGGGLTTESSINTPGVRLRAFLNDRLSYTCEAAYQFGEYGDFDRSAFGGYTYLRYKEENSLYCPERIDIGLIYLSGDNLHTEDNENWDPVFARWPKWSESYIYTQIKEDLVAYWTNLMSIYIQTEFKLDSQLRLHIDYHHLRAPRASSPSFSFPGGGGQTRGNLIIGNLNFRINKYLTGHLLWEWFAPGDYYFDNADSYSWTRVEFLFRI